MGLEAQLFYVFSSWIPQPKLEFVLQAVSFALEPRKNVNKQLKWVFEKKIPWMQGSKIEARVSRLWSNLTNDEMMAMMMKVTNIYKHEIVDTRA